MAIVSGEAEYARGWNEAIAACCRRLEATINLWQAEKEKHKGLLSAACGIRVDLLREEIAAIEEERWRK
jgi:hypothetical protein